MHEMMRVLVLTAAPRYQRMFEVLLECAPGAVLINCSAGKERTGVASALLLTALLCRCGSSGINARAYLCNK